MIKGLLFDLNGTLIDICTSETDDQIYRTVSNFFDYFNIKISPSILKEEYFTILKRQKQESMEEFPEFDVISLFDEITKKYAKNTQNLPSPETLAILFRAAGRYKLELYSEVLPTLKKLSAAYPMAAISDGQKIWALPEMRSVGLDRFFNFVIISSEYGLRKPDPGMFEKALQKMHLRPDEIIFVGNDMFRDIFGAHNLGIKTVFFRTNQGEQNYSGADADYIIYNFAELINAIDFFNS